MRNNLDAFEPMTADEIERKIRRLAIQLSDWGLRDSLVDVTADLHPHIRERIMGLYAVAVAELEILNDALVLAGLNKIPHTQPRL